VDRYSRKLLKKTLQIETIGDDTVKVKVKYKRHNKRWVDWIDEQEIDDEQVQEGR
jgi:hypothetical protein